MADDRFGELSGELDDCFGSDVPAIKLGAKKLTSTTRRAMKGPTDGCLRHWAQVDVAFRLQAGVWDHPSEGSVQMAS